MYGWANSAFATTVMAGFFPLFFKQYWSAEVAATTSSFWLGLAECPGQPGDYARLAAAGRDGGSGARKNAGCWCSACWAF